jgi:Mn-dependent DtxR family transcriptional regulator
MTWAVTLLMYMEDMRVVTISEVADCLEVDSVTAAGMLYGLCNRGWLRFCRPFGWQLTGTGWLMASGQ